MSNRVVDEVFDIASRIFEVPHSFLDVRSNINSLSVLGEYLSSNEIPATLEISKDGLFYDIIEYPITVDKGILSLDISKLFHGTEKVVYNDTVGSDGFFSFHFPPILFVMELEKVLKIDIMDEEAEKLENLGEVISLIEQKKKIKS